MDWKEIWRYCGSCKEKALAVYEARCKMRDGSTVKGAVCECSKCKKHWFRWLF